MTEVDYASEVAKLSEEQVVEQLEYFVSCLDRGFHTKGEFAWLVIDYMRMRGEDWMLLSCRDMQRLIFARRDILDIPVKKYQYRA